MPLDHRLLVPHVVLDLDGEVEVLEDAGLLEEALLVSGPLLVGVVDGEGGVHRGIDY